MYRSDIIPGARLGTGDWGLGTRRVIPSGAPKVRSRGISVVRIEGSYPSGIYDKETRKKPDQRGPTPVDAAKLA